LGTDQTKAKQFILSELKNEMKDERKLSFLGHLISTVLEDLSKQGFGHF